jgi:hypothetical protein
MQQLRDLLGHKSGAADQRASSTQS